ncbi:hypothetical protein CI238_07295 [Colletotrichum incanum]|uniref:F-box domain-containing protein n=1 Tax=Colletotrichum incanum TaxID=1573173 RepID=A0A161VRV6_COLIC|nr:hypothetical protein CI238_07295 [Colletotrichum incanum]
MSEMRESQPPPGLWNIAPELFSTILSYLEIRELRPLMETCQAINSLTGPTFYEKIFTKQGSRYDTAGLVDLLTRRPFIRNLVYYLVIDELDEGALRQLLAFDMPKLRSILVQHEKDIMKPTGTEIKRSLNTLVCEKPQIQNYSAVDFFPLENLNELHIEASKVSLAALKKFFVPAKSLSIFRFINQLEFPCAPDEFSSVLASSRETVKVLKLFWQGFHLPDTPCMSFSDFTAMRQLVVDPRALFGSYTVESDMKTLIKERMPPNLKVLSLDNVQPVVRSVRRGRGYPLKPVYKKLLSTIIEEKERLTPHLKYLTYYYAENCIEDIGMYPFKDHGMLLASLYTEDEPTYSNDWLDSNDARME